MKKTNLRLMEFFNGENGVRSMPRLLCFLSFWPATGVLILRSTETMFGLYIGTYATSYLGGKTVDIFMKRNKK